MHPDERAFLAAVRAQPDDDTVRLVYADWLEEYGGRPERAELIRVQCELANRFRPPYGYYSRLTEPHHKGCTRKHGKVRAFEKSGVCELCRKRREVSRHYLRVAALEKRERALLDAACGPLTTPVFSSPYLTFGRGFIDEIECPWEAWAGHADWLLAREWVPRVRLTTNPQIGFGDGPDSYQLAGLPIHINARATDVLELLGSRWPGVAFMLPPDTTSEEGDGVGAPGEHLSYP